jgi:hypothetical protein
MRSTHEESSWTSLRSSCRGESQPIRFLCRIPVNPRRNPFQYLCPRRVKPDGSVSRLWTFLIVLPHPTTWNTKGSVLTLMEAAMSSSNALATKEAMMVLLDEVYKVG